MVGGRVASVDGLGAEGSSGMGVGSYGRGVGLRRLSARRGCGRQRRCNAGAAPKGETLGCAIGTEMCFLFLFVGILACVIFFVFSAGAQCLFD